jgi:hypothetical protein
MSSKVMVQTNKIRQNLMCVENKLVINWLNLNVPLASPSWPLYIGG